MLVSKVTSVFMFDCLSVNKTARSSGGRDCCEVPDKSAGLTQVLASELLPTIPSSKQQRQ